jgi:hypothetical protein
MVLFAMTSIIGLVKTLVRYILNLFGTALFHLSPENYYTGLLLTNSSPKNSLVSLGRMKLELLQF